MPVTGAKKKIKEELIEADGWEVIAIYVVKPIAPDENNPARVRVIWGCTDAGIDTGETVEVSLNGQEAVDYMTSLPILYDDLLSEATALGISEGVLPSNASKVIKAK